MKVSVCSTAQPVVSTSSVVGWWSWRSSLVTASGPVGPSSALPLSPSGAPATESPRRDLLTGLLERGNLGNLSSGAGVVVGLGTGLGLGWCHVVAVPTGAPFSGVGSVRVGCVCCACRVTMKLALLGDSIAWGQGAAREQERLAPRLEAGLAVHGFDTVAKVFAQPGARSSSLPPQVAAAVRWAPGLAVIVIGANDLTHFEAARPAVQALADAVRELRAAGAQVVVAPAPDLSAVPHVPPVLRDIVRAAGDEFRASQVAAVLAEGGRVADGDQRASRAFAVDPSLFSADRFHPSSAGYAVIADSLLPTVLDAARAVEPVS